MGGNARRGRPPHPGTFTPAEARVLEHLRAGHSNADIADALGVTIHAVKFHVSSMLAKTGATTREELAAWQPGREPVSTRPRWWATFTTLGAAKVTASLAVIGIGLAGAALTISAIAGGDHNDELPAVEEPSTTTQPNGVEVPLATPARRLTSYRMVSQSLSDPPDVEQAVREETRTVYYKAPDKRLEIIERRIGDELTVYHELRLGAMFWRWDPAGGPVVETDQVAQFGGLGPYEPALWPARMRDLEEVIYYNLSGQQIDGVVQETVLGRPAWKLTVSAEKCNPRGHASSGGRQTVWIDQETLFPLQGELLRPDGNLLFKGETTELELDPVLPDSLFEYPKDRELLVTVNDPPWTVVSVTPSPSRTPSGCPIRDDANLRAVTAGGASTLVPATPTP